LGLSPRYADEQIALARKQAETGTPVAESGGNTIIAAQAVTRQRACHYISRRK
jgi:hypothetical protein